MSEGKLRVERNEDKVIDITKMSDLVDTRVKDGNYFTLEFDEKTAFDLPITSRMIGGKRVTSVSAILPMNHALLIGEYGFVGMIQVLNFVRNNATVNIPAKLVILGIGTEVPEGYEIGMRFIPKMRETHIMRNAMDPNNHFSFSALANKISNDKYLLAAVAITGNKDKSRVGLRLDDTTISAETLKEMERLQSQGGHKGYEDALFRDKNLPFINYYLMDWHNIDAIINDNQNPR